MAMCLKKAILGAPLIAALAIVVGHIYEWVGERRDREQLPQVGRSVTSAAEG